MNGTVVRNIRRADAAALAALEKLGVATVHEAQGRSGLMRPDVRPVWSGARLCGSAVTALIHPGDNWMIHVAVEQCREGDVLVVAPTSPSDAGYFRELLATSLAAHGVRGLVIDAGARAAADDRVTVLEPGPRPGPRTAPAVRTPGGAPRSHEGTRS